jgi:hypothetical protein
METMDPRGEVWSIGIFGNPELLQCTICTHPGMRSTTSQIDEIYGFNLMGGTLLKKSIEQFN